MRWGGRMRAPLGARQKKGELRRLWGEVRGEGILLKEMRISAVSGKGERGE